jgi:hypothetical protein
MFMKHQYKRQYWEPLRHVYQASERETILGTPKTCLSSIKTRDNTEERYSMFIKHQNERKYWEPLKHVYEASEREIILGTTKTCL